MKIKSIFNGKFIRSDKIYSYLELVFFFLLWILFRVHEWKKEQKNKKEFMLLESVWSSEKMNWYLGLFFYLGDHKFYLHLLIFCSFLNESLI